MVKPSRYQVIKRLQAGLPRGAPFDLATLGPFGVSPQLAAHYAGSGWLFKNSPDLTQAHINAIIDALAAHTTLSTEALNSDKVRARFLHLFLGPGNLCEELVTLLTHFHQGEESQILWKYRES